MVAYSQLWVVVADGEHARIVVRQPHERVLHTQKVLTSADAGVSAHEMGADRPGRVHESLGSSRHAIAPRHDPHEAAKVRFIDALADEINRASADERFAHLVLVCSSRLMGELHGALDAATRTKVVGTLGKDLTKVGDHELVPHLREWL